MLASYITKSQRSHFQHVHSVRLQRASSFFHRPLTNLDVFIFFGPSQRENPVYYNIDKRAFYVPILPRGADVIMTSSTMSFYCIHREKANIILDNNS